eukprot:g4001.t1
MERLNRRREAYDRSGEIRLSNHWRKERDKQLAESAKTTGNKQAAIAAGIFNFSNVKNADELYIAAEAAVAKVMGTSSVETVEGATSSLSKTGKLEESVTFKMANLLTSTVGKEQKSKEVEDSSENDNDFRILFRNQQRDLSMALQGIKNVPIKKSMQVEPKKNVVEDKNKDEIYECENGCGYSGLYADVCAHEVSGECKFCSPKKSNVVSRASRLSNERRQKQVKDVKTENEQTLACEYSALELELEGLESELTNMLEISSEANGSEQEIKKQYEKLAVTKRISEIESRMEQIEEIGMKNEKEEDANSFHGEEVFPQIQVQPSVTVQSLRQEVIASRNQNENGNGTDEVTTENFADKILEQEQLQLIVNRPAMTSNKTALQIDDIWDNAQRNAKDLAKLALLQKKPNFELFQKSNLKRSEKVEKSDLLSDKVEELFTFPEKSTAVTNTEFATILASTAKGYEHPKIEKIEKNIKVEDENEDEDEIEDEEDVRPLRRRRKRVKPIVEVQEKSKKVRKIKIRRKRKKNPK